LQSFWSFLFVFSGIVVVIIGIVSLFSGWLAVKDFFLPTHFICFIAGVFYLVIGIGIALQKMRKHKFE